MRSSYLAGVVAIAATLTCGSALSVESTAASALQARSSDAEGVRVVVQPRTAAPSAGTWEFEVRMDTHTKPLNDDLVRAAVLVDDSGRRLAPSAWQGDPSGGHHRKGILRFSFDAEKPKSVELQIEGIGGAGKRVFQWQLE
jgi:hypothetical protein